MAKLNIPNTGSMTVKAPKSSGSTKKPTVKRAATFAHRSEKISRAGA